LASRDVAWFAVGASLFASNIGSEHLVGLAGTGAGSGLAVGRFEWLACLILLLLGWLFVPYYLKSGVYTMPEFLEKRYNSAARTYFTWVSVIGYVLTKISVALYAGGVVIRAVTVWNFFTAAVVLIIVTGLYTIFGGLRAVVYTEVLQAIVLILGSATLMIIGLQHVGGIAALKAKVPAGFFSMWKPISDPNFHWTGIIFGAPILGIWYWVNHPHVVPRVCSALLTGYGYKKMRPAASEMQLVKVGRISAGIMVVLGLAWIPFMKYISSQVYIYLQSVQAYIAPPIAACFLLGIFFKRLNGKG